MAPSIVCKNAIGQVNAIDPIVSRRMRKLSLLPLRKPRSFYPSLRLFTLSDTLPCCRLVDNFATSVTNFYLAVERFRASEGTPNSNMKVGNLT